jgi:uncharacterized protein YggE
MKAFIAVVSLLLAATLAGGQEACPLPKLVKTIGTAEVKVRPDEAMIQLGVERQSPTAKAAKAAVSSTSRKLLAALKRLGLEDKDMQTAYLNLDLMIDYRKGVRIVNFTAEQSLSVKVRDLSKLDDVMDAVIAAGANRIDGVEYQSSELRKYKDQARDEAAKAAQEKAEALAEALGTQIGKTHSIEEVQQDDRYPYSLALPSVVIAGMPDKRAPSTAPGELTVKASVVVSFDLL